MSEEIKEDVTKKIEPVTNNEPVLTKPTSKFVKFMKWCFPPKNPKENILQYIARQFLVVDAHGDPSITVTILVYVLILVGIVTLTETKIAQQPASATKGYSDTFLYLIIGLSVVITGWYRGRQNKIGSNEAGETQQGLLNTIKTYVQEVVGKIIK